MSSGGAGSRAKRKAKPKAEPRPKPSNGVKTRRKRVPKNPVTVLTQSSGTTGATKTKTKTKTKTDTTKTSSAYNNDFMQILINNYINLDLRKSKPKNLGLYRNRLDRRRESLSSESFPESRYDEFLDAVTNAATEPDVMRTVFPIIIGKPHYPSISDRQCTTWASLVEENLVSAKPDYFDGKAPGPDDQTIRQHLHPYIVPSTVSPTPFLTNFFVEAKAKVGTMAVAERQACYDGALGARNMHKVQTYLKDQHTMIFDDNAYTMSATYVGGTLDLYTHHLSQPNGPGSRVNYHMTCIGSWSLRGSSRTFREGVSALRNARDLMNATLGLCIEA